MGHRICNSHESEARRSEQLDQREATLKAQHQKRLEKELLAKQRVKKARAQAHLQQLERLLKEVATLKAALELNRGGRGGRAIIRRRIKSLTIDGSFEQRRLGTEHCARGKRKLNRQDRVFLPTI